MTARALLLLLALLAAPPAAAQEEDAITPARLKRDLEQGAKLFRQNPDPASARGYAARLSFADVQWNDGVISVRDPWLEDATAAIDSLSPEARRKQNDAIADHLAARATQVDAAFPTDAAATAAATAAPGEAKTPDEILEAILDQKQYHVPEEDPKLAEAAARVRDSVRRAWTAVKDFVADLFRPRREEQSLWDRVKSVLVMGLAALGVLALIFFVVRLLLRAAVDTAVDPAETEMPEDPPHPAEMAAEAKALFDDGDLRGAVRALYLALLGRLHQQGVIVYDRHRTNREYLRSMRAGAERKRAFAAVVETFDRKWYGKESCTRDEVEAFELETFRAGDPAADGPGTPRGDVQAGASP